MGPFVKRLWVKFRPPGRAIRLNMETHLDQIEVAFSQDEPMTYRDGQEREMAKWAQPPPRCRTPTD
jgi:hypothetical protein